MISLKIKLIRLSLLSFLYCFWMYFYLIYTIQKLSSVKLILIMKKFEVWKLVALIEITESVYLYNLKLPRISLNLLKTYCQFSWQYSIWLFSYSWRFWLNLTWLNESILQSQNSEVSIWLASRISKYQIRFITDDLLTMMEGNLNIFNSNMC